MHTNTKYKFSYKVPQEMIFVNYLKIVCPRKIFVLKRAKFIFQIFCSNVVFHQCRPVTRTLPCPDPHKKTPLLLTAMFKLFCSNKVTNKKYKKKYSYKMLKGKI